MDVFAYRRDSTYSANLHIKKTRWYGQQAVKEYKIKRGYFFHTIITVKGWIISMGGPDIPILDRKVEKLAGKITLKGHINKNDLKRIYNLIKKSKMGHFMIKSPDDNVGLVSYYSGRSRFKIFKMKNKNYICVPNSPRYYKKGIYTSKKSNPLSAAIYIAGNDRWGVGRRNIISYQINQKTIPTANNEYSLTAVKIWASYDGGKMVKKHDYGKPDNIIYRGQLIKAKSIPPLLNKKYLGTTILKN